MPTCIFNRPGTSADRMTADKTPTLDLSFLILSWNSAQYLEQCIAGIDRAMKESRFAYEILVFENGSRDETPRLLKQLAAERPNVIFAHFATRNCGTTKSRNRLFNTARGRFLCVLDSDVELPQGVIDILLPILEKSPRIGIITPRITYPSGAWQKSFDRFPTLFDKINRLVRLRSIEKKESENVAADTQAFFVDYAISAFWLMPQEVLQRVGGLDEKIFYAPEDVDFCLRLWKTGYQILYVPAVSIVHHTQEISRGLKLNRAKLNHIKGLCYYFLKHRYLLRRPQMIHGSPASFNS